MDASITWDHDQTFVAEASSGFRLPIGEGDIGCRPMELLLFSLAGCTAVDVLSILQKKRQKLTGFEIQVKSDRSPEHPRRFTAITLNYVVKGEQIDPAAVERAIELSLTKYCSVHATLTQSVPIRSAYQIR